MNQDLVVITTANNAHYLAETPETLDVAVLVMKISNEFASNTDIKNFIASDMLGNLSEIKFPKDNVLVDRLDGSLQLVYQTYLKLAVDAKDMALRQVTVSTFFELTSALGK